MANLLALVFSPCCSLDVDKIHTYSKNMYFFLIVRRHGTVSFDIPADYCPRGSNLYCLLNCFLLISLVEYYFNIPLSKIKPIFHVPQALNLIKWSQKIHFFV